MDFNNQPYDIDQYYKFETRHDETDDDGVTVKQAVGFCMRFGIM